MVAGVFRSWWSSWWGHFQKHQRRKVLPHVRPHAAKAAGISRRGQQREERSSARQVVLGLCNTRLFRQRIHVVRYDIENLIELSKDFGETTKTDIGIRVLGEQVSVARVEPVGFVEVRLAPVPQASPPFE
jgi:hypothetical protein